MRTLAVALAAGQGAAPASPPPAAAGPAAPAGDWEDVPSPDAARAATPPPPAKAETPPPVPPYAPPPSQVTPPPPYAPPQAQPQPPPRATPTPPAAAAKQRGGWYIGFGLGAGDASFSFEGAGAKAGLRELVPGGGAPYAFNFRVGGTLTPKLLLGFDGGFLAADGDGDSSVELDTYGIGFMFFPNERGFYLRGAIGESELEQDLPGLGKSSASGWNVTGGFGYAFWLGKAFNLTLNVDVQHHSFRSSNVQDATAWSAWLGFDWY